jgi:hypothetical protein
VSAPKKASQLKRARSLEREAARSIIASADRSVVGLREDRKRSANEAIEARSRPRNRID